MIESLSIWAQLYLYPSLVTLALWGGLTMGLVWVNNRGARFGRLVLLVLLPLLLLTHQQLWQVRLDTSIWGCYLSFLGGMLIWTWHELAFYSGVLTGPWRRACPPALSGWQRFRYALGTHIYHEIAVVLEIGWLWWLHQDASNLIGPLTFVSMWALQHSAKLNVLLGVPNLQVSLFPQHLRYLATFWNRRSHTPLFLASIFFSSALALLLWIQAAMLAPHPYTVGITLLAAMMTLGVLEHWLLVLPPGFGFSQEAPAQPPPKAEAHRWKPDA